jgi:nuclear pore complex protein Nup98-Nup96
MCFFKKKSIIPTQPLMSTHSSNTSVCVGAYTPGDTAFTHLTGHQVEKACAVAADGGFLKLSTLISQAGGDEVFKDDIREQLRVWKAEKLGPGAGTGFGSGLVGRGVWKVYSLLGGILDDDEEELADKDADICSGLDWKRVFGLCLWYDQGLEASIANVVKSYERLVLRQSNSTPTAPNNNSNKTKSTAKPLPPWLLDVQRKKFPAALFTKWSNQSSAPTTSEPDDPLYGLIKLHADPALSLSTILDPLSFSSSLMEAGIAMCWHLYIILSRVMQIRDFADRRPSGGGPSTIRRTLMNGGGREGSSDGEDSYGKLAVDGHSPTADLLSSAYAFELESWGMIQEAIFVLLHIEGSVG